MPYFSSPSSKSLLSKDIGNLMNRQPTSVPTALAKVLTPDQFIVSRSDLVRFQKEAVVLEERASRVSTALTLLHVAAAPASYAVAKHAGSSTGEALAIGAFLGPMYLVYKGVQVAIEGKGALSPRR